MRGILFFILLLSATYSISKERSDSTKNPLKFSGNLSLNSNGIAPIPSFALGKPAVSANLSVVKGRFSYDPQLSYGLDFKPWIIDNWFHYKLINTAKFELRTGVNISSFFSDYKTPDQTIRQSQRYFTLELAGIRTLSKTSSIGLMFWYDKGVDPGTVEGYFINLVADKSNIPLGKYILMGINIQTFIVDYTSNSDGLFISPKISFDATKAPFFVFYHGIHPITSNIEPYPSFQWNVGVGYSF